MQLTEVFNSVESKEHLASWKTTTATATATATTTTTTTTEQKEEQNGAPSIVDDSISCSRSVQEKCQKF